MPTPSGAPSVTAQATAVSPPPGPTGATGSGMFCLVLWATLLQPRLSKDESLSMLLQSPAPQAELRVVHVGSRKLLAGWLTDGFPNSSPWLNRPIFPHFRKAVRTGPRAHSKFFKICFFLE